MPVLRSLGAHLYCLVAVVMSSPALSVRLLPLPCRPALLAWLVGWSGVAAQRRGGRGGAGRRARRGGASEVSPESASPLSLAASGATGPEQSSSRTNEAKVPKCCLSGAEPTRRRSTAGRASEWLQLKSGVDSGQERRQSDREDRRSNRSLLPITTPRASYSATCLFQPTS